MKVPKLPHAFLLCLLSGLSLSVPACGNDDDPGSDPGPEVGGALDGGGDAGEAGGLGPGADCAHSGECTSGLCLESLGGSRACAASCDTATPCQEPRERCASVPGISGQVCIPRFDNLCRPCLGDDDCRAVVQGATVEGGGTCLPATRVEGGTVVTDGSFCGADCDEADAPCPTGYSCLLVTGAPQKQCVRDEGACPCLPEWDGLPARCAIEVPGVGQCSASRVCAASEWTACAAITPSAEVCDGQDNDCDGEVDNGDTVCPDDGLNCTVESCKGVQGCKTAIASGTCLIAGQCWAAGDTNPDNACEACLSGFPASWSTTNATGCSIGGSCWANGTPNPQNACEACVSSVSASGWSENANACIVDGVCYAAGAANPARPCEVCDPSKSKTSLVLVDGTCLIDGQCRAGGEPNPADPCFECAPSLSTSDWVLGPNRCLIGGECHDAGDVHPDNVCRACRPGTSQQAWSDRPSTVLCAPSTDCSHASYCSEGTCMPQTFDPDANEPNDTPATATFLGTTNEDDANALTGAGVVGGAADRDWFLAYFDENTTLHVVNPEIAIQSTESLRVCTYTRCTASSNDGIACLDGSTSDGSMAGYMGCCKSGTGFSFRPDHDCTNIGIYDPDDAEVYVLVEQIAGGPTCSGYSFRLHF